MTGRICLGTWSCVLLVLTGLAPAGPVSFSGSARVSGEYGWVNGDSLVEPRPELRLSVNPTLSLWSVPVGMNILVSTDENNLRQQLNRFRLFLSPKEWLESQAGLSGLALSIRNIELGSCSPSWTPHTLAGAPVLGGTFELNPWFLYLAGAAGRTRRAVAVSDSTDGAYAQMLYSARFGFGRKERTHFYLTGLYITDDSASLHGNTLPMPGDTTVPPDSFEAVRPQENYILGAEFKLHLLEGALTLESELTGSELTRDTRLPLESWDWLPDWVEKTFRPRMSSSIDYAVKVRPALTVFDTKLTGRFEYVGPGYVSLGAPGLRNDNQAIGAGMERDFLDRAISVSIGCSAERDNLLSAAVRDTAGRPAGMLSLKSRTTRFTSWEANLGLQFPDLPYLQAGYSPYAQASDSLDSLAQAASTNSASGNVISVSAGHGFASGRLSHSPSVSFGYNDLRGDDPAGDYASWSASLNHGVAFEFPLSLSAGVGWARTDVADETPDTRVCLDFSPSYTLFEKWHNSLFLGATLGSGTRIDARLSSSFPLGRICDARLGLADAVYRGADGRYNDLRLTAELSRGW
ncbi:MAG: hypothetical protein R6X12_03595 [bacterium]